MPRTKAAFSIQPDAESPNASVPPSRSTSRDRNHLSSSSPKTHPPPPLAQHNSSRHHSDIAPCSPPPHRLFDLDEEAALESSGTETEALLSSAASAKGTPRRRLSLRENGYGATIDARTGQARFLEDGAPLQRQESVLRLAGLIDDRAGEFERFRKSPEELQKLPKRIRRFYERQNDQLDGFAEVDEILEGARAKAATGELVPMGPRTTEREETFRSAVTWAINLNIVINILLLGAKIAVVLLSHSMSLVASTVDSAMDFLSTLIIFGTSRYIEHRDWKSQYIYPTGKSRMEPLGVLVFSVFMISSFLQVLIESIQKILDGANLDQTALPNVALAVMGATIVIKTAVWLSCRAIKSASVEALQQDAENDIVFNFFSILFPFVGTLLRWKYLDPIGGAVLSLYIIIEWTRTLLDNVRKLTGRRAPPQEHQRVAYLLTRFSPLVTAVQHLSVYHAGEGMIVEVDLVLPAQTSLTTAHDVGEAAQYAIEELEGVERAFVHIDVTVNPYSGHYER
ncbi:hypothetical protein JCM10213_006562 [Rhodosporidiobolus nylandii]